LKSIARVKDVPPSRCDEVILVAALLAPIHATPVAKFATRTRTALACARPFGRRTSVALVKRKYQFLEKFFDVLAKSHVFLKSMPATQVTEWLGFQNILVSANYFLVGDIYGKNTILISKRNREMIFSMWLFTEEQQNPAIRSRKDPNPKDPNKSFLVLYGNTAPVSSELRKLGFSFFRPTATWSTSSLRVDNLIRDRLKSLGVDMSGYDAPTEAPRTPPQTQQDTPADETLERMHGELGKVFTDDPKTQQLIDSIEKMIERVAESTDEAAKQSFIRNFLDFSSKFYNYSLHNQFLIWIQTKGKARHVAGAKAWEQKFGRAVRDWKSPITILMPRTSKREVLNPKTGEKEEKQNMFFTTGKVYDISSTVAIPGHPSPFEPVGRKDWSKDSNEDVEEITRLINALADWTKANNINVNYEDMDAEKGGYSAGGKIAINNTFKGINQFSTFVHEVAHEILHWKNKDVESTSQEKEIDAETTAYIVLNHFGFETKDTSNYLALWRAKGDDVRARRKNIQQASKEIINGIKSQEEKSEIEESHDPSQADILFTAFLKDGTIIVKVGEKRKKFVVDAILHDRIRKMKPSDAYSLITKMVEKGDAFEI
jgi:hypothetical protein